MWSWPAEWALAAPHHLGAAEDHSFVQKNGVKCQGRTLAGICSNQSLGKNFQGVFAQGTILMSWTMTNAHVPGIVCGRYTEYAN